MSDYINYENIPEYLGIKKGGALLVSSDITSLAMHAFREEGRFDPSLLLDSLIKALGPSGTLLLPVYNWDFCGGVAFDYKNTPCKTGSLGVAALKRADFKRTKHPIYSFAVWGKDQELLCSMENKSAFGADSPFMYLYKKAQNLLIDVDLQNSFTFIHFVEEQCRAKYRYLKDFKASYIDDKGIKSDRTYSMYVRDLNLSVQNNINPIEELFLKAGVEATTELNGIKFRMVDLKKAYAVIKEDIENNYSRRLCSYNGQPR